MTELVKFPSIGKFADTVRNIAYRTRFIGKDADGNPLFDGERSLPILSAVGRVKLHGTNASISFQEDGSWHAQSRERILSVEEDNMGFARFLHGTVGEQNLSDMFEQIKVLHGPDVVYPITVYGEWCGTGIQSGVGLSKVPKMFVIFGVRFGKYSDDDEDSTGFNGSYWGDIDIYTPLENRDVGIYHTNIFGKYVLSIDFNDPKQVVDSLDQLTLSVEQRCPAAMYFGVDGVGEGLVWSIDNPEFRSSRFWFKTKGDKHKERKGRDTEVDPAKQAALNSANAIVEEFLVEARLQRGLSHLTEAGLPVSKDSTGEFVKWVVSDIVKDAKQEIIAADLDPKAIGGVASKRISSWYFKHLNALQGL